MNDKPSHPFSHLTVFIFVYNSDCIYFSNGKSYSVQLVILMLLFQSFMNMHCNFGILCYFMVSSDEHRV